MKAPVSKAGATATPDSTMRIKAGESGKNFNSITVEGEDRVRVNFDRPELSSTSIRQGTGLTGKAVGGTRRRRFQLRRPCPVALVYERSP